MLLRYKIGHRSPTKAAYQEIPSHWFDLNGHVNGHLNTLIASGSFRIKMLLRFKIGQLNNNPLGIYKSSLTRNTIASVWSEFVNVHLNTLIAYNSLSLFNNISQIPAVICLHYPLIFRVYLLGRSDSKIVERTKCLMKK